MRKKVKRIDPFIVVDDPIFKTTVMVVVGPYDYYRTAMLGAFKVDPGELEPGVCGLFEPIQSTDKQTTVGVIWVPDWGISCLVHEIIHCVLWALEYRGMIVDESDDEVVSYFAEYLIKEILKHNPKFDGMI